MPRAAIENVRTIKAHEPGMFSELEADEQDTSAHPLESPEVQARFTRVQEWRRQAKVAQRSNRREQATDEDFYDGLQWRDEDIKVLEARGQAPLVYNVVKNTINWLLGTERKTRIDYRVLPRGDEDRDGADVKTKLLKYVQDVNRAQYARSKAFADAVKVGVGWLEIGSRGDEEDEPLFVRAESWRNIWHDHLSVEQDMSDARFLIRERWTDLDIAQAMFPERADALAVEAENTNRLYPYLPDDFLLDDPATDGSDYAGEWDIFDIGNRRSRVKLVECWYKVPAQVRVMKTKGALNGAMYRNDDPLHQYMLDNGYASTYDATRMVTRCMIFAGSTVLQDAASPYNHNRFPFVPVICYRRGRDGAFYGVIRDIRDPQEDLNKRKSKALWLASANQVIAEQGAVADPKAAHEEIQRPDGWVETISDKRFEIVKQAPLVAQHVQLAQDDERFIQSISGVNDENLGKKSNAVSGYAIELRQNQGQTTSGVAFDNLYFATQSCGELELSVLEQFYTDEKTVRILGDSGQLEFLTVNKYDDQTQIVQDDITASKADFVVSQQDYRETLRMQMAETLNQMVTGLAQTAPNIAIALLDLVVEQYDIPGKDEMVARIRKINGQRDPASQLTPEEQAAQDQKEQAEAAQQQQMQAFQQKMLELDMELKAAKVAREKAEIAVRNVEAMFSSIQTAQVVVTTPGIAPVADAIGKSAGLVDHDEPPLYPVDAQQPPAQGLPPMPENTHPQYPANPEQGMMVGIDGGDNGGMQP